MASNFDYEAYFAKSRHSAIEKARFELAKAEDMREAICDYITLIHNAIDDIGVPTNYAKECNKIRSAIAKVTMREFDKYDCEQ